MRPLFLMLLFLVMSGCAANRTGPGEETLRIGDAMIRLDIEPQIPLPRAVVIEWVRRAAEAVRTYLGRFPVKDVTIIVRGGGDEPVGEGVTHGTSDIQVQLGSSVHRDDLLKDWVMTHEMFHLAFPTLDHRYLWMMEGLSDYLEPIARARAGQWSPNDAWLEFVEGLPQGLPNRGQGGLDNSHNRERIYWGGNIYWLLADLQIRVQTDNRRGLDDAIRAILAAGGNGSADWPLEHVLEVGDKATGTTVLKDLYEQMGPKRGNVDLINLWKQLGVRYSRGKVTFDETAPWAKYRRAITEPMVSSK